ncbi:MAG: CpsD/CapB family tyrosine-protein kinase [Planctomycetes bacterium]|nr:CpsD/CapB family tyrosine-protein kinase [Planctomycetota bacterium]MCB9890020.1 CpsD/CapB family tyrosine-protein kinase [Planctomycetota bacterium]
MKRKSDIPEEDAGPQMLVVVDRVVDPYLVCFHDPTGFRAEQFRALRNKLTVLNTDHASVTLVVTSAIQGEGKSTTALNLGMALAELEDHQILVAEFDFRRPSIERMLGLNPEPGLVELLHDGIGLDRAIRPSGIPNLDILAAGARPSNPSELIASRRIDELLAELKEQYHYVILDTPPILPITDAGILGAKCDGTLLVVGLEKAPRRMVRDSIATLEDLGANLLGTFVTGIRGADPAADERYRYRYVEGD